jgi:NADH-quinone oxidoreductase subunit G
MTASTTEKTATVNLTIDGIPVTVPKGTTVYHAARQLEIDVPIFCYQDRMPPFGACRVCLVEVEKMPKLQTSCTLEATEGMVVKTNSKMAEEGRQGILEFLLINHPLDCPICDRGGECPLQDQTLKFGPGKSRFHEEKRHFTKAYPLGPVLMLDRERCIVCARCTRFGDIVAGDHALEFIERGFKTEVGTPDGKPAESKFIGNTIMICPVGALTSDVYRFRARPWDNDSTNSTCTLCPVGCSMILDSRDGEIVRTRSHENPNVNDIWLCDKGWFGYEFVYANDRLQKPLIRRNDKLLPATWEEALSVIAEKLSAAKASGQIAGLGGNPLTTEENYLFQKLIREGGGVNNVDHRVGTPIIDINDEGIAPGMEMTIGNCEKLSYAVLFGLDITEEFPVVWLRLKQAINHGAKVIFIGYYAPEVTNNIEKTIVHAPGDEVEVIRQHQPLLKELLQRGGNGAFFVGSQYLLNQNRKAILSEIQQLKSGSKSFTINVLEGRGNSVGARLAGMHPQLGPKPGLNTVQILEQAAKSGWEYLHVAGADPAAKFPSELWNQVRAKLDFLVVQELFLTETARQADVVLPTLSFIEKEGSFNNIEGRKQHLQPGKDIPSNILSDQEIFIRLAMKLGVPSAREIKVPDWKRGESNLTNVESKKEAYQGSMKAVFAHALFDHGNRMKNNPHLVQLAKEPMIRIHPQEGTRMGLRDGQHVAVKTNGKEIRGKVKLDRRVSAGTVVIPLGFPELPVHELGVNLFNGIPISLERR